MPKAVVSHALIVGGPALRHFGRRRHRTALGTAGGAQPDARWDDAARRNPARRQLTGFATAGRSLALDATALVLRDCGRR